MIRFIILASLLGLGCSPEAAKQYIRPSVEIDKQIEDPNAVYFDPQVDILFVVDNSGSMSSHQANLTNNISLFTNTFLQNSVLDYNIGVIVTGDDFTTSEGDGKLINRGGKTFVNRLTLNSSVILEKNLAVGINGSGDEQVFDPTHLALTKHLTGFNAGFYRPTASLIVIFVTDAEDHSRTMNGVTMKDFLLRLKGNDPRKVLVFGVIIPTPEQNCTRDAFETPVRIESFLATFQLPNLSNTLSLCSPNYGAELTKMADTIVNQIGSVILLAKLPDLKTLRVKYGSIDLPNDPAKGWSYSLEKNAVILGDQIDWTAQPSGSRVKVFYDAIKF